jgi:glutathione S-transferase
MPTQPDASIEITAFDWVPDFARGFVRDLRPRWACEEMGLPYRERLISAVNRPGWYYEEQPWGQVPVIRDGDVHLFESGAILLHLGEKSTQLLPASGQARADVLSWLFAAYNSVEPVTMELATVTLFASGEDWAEGRKPSLFAFLEKRLSCLTNSLGDREWAAGAFSIADIALVTTLRELSRTDLFDRFPSLRAYVERGEARPAFQRALDAQLAAFTDQPQAA